MKKIKSLFIITVAISLYGFNGWTTVDSIGKGFIPYSPAQEGIYSYDDLAKNWNTEYASTQSFCMTTFMYYDSYSSSEIPKYSFMMEPFTIPLYPQIEVDGEVQKSVQINELADGKLKVETDWDLFEQYVEVGNSDGWSTYIKEPTFKIDVSAYDQSTKGGRLEAITKAKLAVISLHYNLAAYGRLFRLTVEITGLPSDQSEFKKEGFTPIPAVTKFPYSGPSPLAQAFYKELLAPYSCEKTLEEVSQFVD